MSLLDLILLSVGLAMDAFAVAICKGLAVRRVHLGQMTVVGAYFGIFQAGMPLIGFFLANLFADQIQAIDHWVTFALLAVLGINMIREAFSKEESCPNASFGFFAMLPLALATSIDAMAVGVTFAMQEVSVALAVTLIGVVTFVISAIGVKIGNLFGSRFQAKAELFGGAVLVLMGIKFLLQGLGVLPE